GTLSARVTDPDTGDLVPLPYDQEEVTAYEIGYKGTHLDNTLQVNMSLYTYDYTGYQDNVTVYDADRAAQVEIVKNAPKARNSGFEVEATWLPTDALTVGGNFSLTKTEYTEDYFIAVSDDPAHPASLFGSSATNPDLFIKNAKGSQLKKIPEKKATIWAQYLIETGFGNVTLGGTYAYTGDYYDEGYERELDRVPSQGRLDLTVTWEDVARDWRIQAFARNVTDEDNLRDVTTGTEASNWRMSGAILQPRYVGFNVTRTFGPH
ncbi:MAG: TonB-dependent receptor, partial [Pseudomonadales bacterium]|nr:TonB-dependent receptor [Pseudomonadales bacterium]